MIDSRRFSGVRRLYGDAAAAAFGASRVTVIGIGGVGTWVVEALARTGIGHLTLIDLDMVAESNTNRQLHALGDAFGRPKVDVMAERVRAINPECEVVSIEEFVTAENITQLLPTSEHFIVDAIDQTRVKVAIAAHCKESATSLVMAGAAGGRCDPTRIRVDDLAFTQGDSLLSRVRQQLRQQHGFSRNLKQRFGIQAVFSNEPMRGAPPVCAESGGLSCAGYGSAAAVTGAFGLAAAAAVINQLASNAK